MVEGVSAISFIRVLIFFMRVLPSWPNQFPKTLLPNIITLGIRSPYMNFGGEEHSVYCVSVQFSSVTQSCPTFCNPMDCSTPGFPVHHQLLEVTQTYVHWVSDAIQPSHPLLSPFPPAFNFSQHQGFFQWVSSLHQVAKNWSFSFNISPSNEYSGLISFRMDWFDLLAVQVMLKHFL